MTWLQWQRPLPFLVNGLAMRSPGKIASPHTAHLEVAKWEVTIRCVDDRATSAAAALAVSGVERCDSCASVGFSLLRTAVPVIFTTNKPGGAPGVRLTVVGDPMRQT